MLLITMPRKLSTMHHEITLTGKSNAMRKAAKEKDFQLKAVEQQLNEKVLELSNCW